MEGIALRPVVVGALQGHPLCLGPNPGLLGFLPSPTEGTACGVGPAFAWVVLGEVGWGGVVWIGLCWVTLAWFGDTRFAFDQTFAL